MPSDHQRLRQVILGVSLLYLSVYAPLAGMIYLPLWYQANCAWHGRCDRLGDQLTEQSIGNLTAFFAHLESLNQRWSNKENTHLLEVRSMYDALAVLAVISVAALLFTFERRRATKPALINVLLIASLLLLLPVFDYFWRHVFHGALFSNELWKTDRRDITWYLTPRTLFRNSVVVLVASGISVNLLVWWLGRHQAARERQK